MTSAPTTPHSNTLCCASPGTRKYRNKIRKTKRLSTLSDSSTTYPVRNCSIAARPCQKKTSPEKAAASSTQKTVQPTACGRPITGFPRCKPRSSASIANTKRLNATQNCQEVVMKSGACLEKCTESRHQKSDSGRLSFFRPSIIPQL